MASIKANIHDGKIVSYSFRVCLGRDEWGKQITRSIVWKKPAGLSESRLEKTIQKALKEWEKEVRKEYALELANPKRVIDRNAIRTHILLCDFISNEWFPQYIDNEARKPKTVSFYNDTVKNISAYYKGIELQNVTSTSVQRFLNYLRQEREMKAQTIHHHYRTLNMIFSYAFDLEHIAKNPMDKVDAPKLEHNKVDALSAEDASRFFLSLQGSNLEFRCMMLLLITTGIRRGELVGLKWDDINENAFALTICRSVTYTAKNGTVVSSPKTDNSRRTIPLLETVMQELLYYKKSVKEKYSLTSFDGVFMFPVDDPFVPRNPDAVTRRVKRFMKSAGLPDMSPHDLRHTCGSLLLQSGADIKSVQEILGHSNASTTLNFYIRSDFKQMETAVKKMEDAFNLGDKFSKI